MNKNPITVIESTSARLEATCHTKDVTKPVLKSFDFEFDAF
jgi:hypothetical protein